MAELGVLLDSALRDAIDSGKLLGLSYVVIGAGGKMLYSGAHGSRTFASDEPMTLSTAGWMASMTKLMTSVAAMQVVEKGLIGLHDDLAEVIPDLRAEILTGIDEVTGKPTLIKANNRITLSRLLSHSSGLSYDDLDPLLTRWSEVTPNVQALTSGQYSSVNRPLTAEPGTRWRYSTGIDWAGRAVEALTNQSLESYMQENIWSVLGMKNTTFHPRSKQPELAILDMAWRGGGPANLKDSFLNRATADDQDLKPGDNPWPADTEFEFGGAGLYSTAEDYAKLLAALVAKGGAILKPHSTETFFQPQLQSNSSVESLLEQRRLGLVQIDIPEGTKVNHGLGGLLVEQDLGPWRRRKGSMFWDGMSNPQWMIDPQSEIACVFLTQLLPCPDRFVKDLWTRLEEIVYQDRQRVRERT